jgi:hypothetical protein
MNLHMLSATGSCCSTLPPITPSSLTCIVAPLPRHPHAPPGRLLLLLLLLDAALPLLLLLLLTLLRVLVQRPALLVVLPGSCHQPSQVC